MEGSKQLGQARRALAAAVLAATAVVAAPGGSEAAAPKLTGAVGPGFTISLKSAGKKVTSLKAGTYTITVNDRSRIHDFRLRGPGLNKTVSGVSAVGTKTITVKLRAGKYTFTCQPHAAAMHGSFTVR